MYSILRDNYPLRVLLKHFSGENLPLHMWYFVALAITEMFLIYQMAPFSRRHVSLHSSIKAQIPPAGHDVNVNCPHPRLHLTYLRSAGHENSNQRMIL